MAAVYRERRAGLSLTVATGVGPDGGLRDVRGLSAIGAKRARVVIDHVAINLAWGAEPWLGRRFRPGKPFRHFAAAELELGAVFGVRPVPDLVELGVILPAEMTLARCDAGRMNGI